MVKKKQTSGFPVCVKMTIDLIKFHERDFHENGI